MSESESSTWFSWPNFFSKSASAENAGISTKETILLLSPGQEKLESELSKQIKIFVEMMPMFYLSGFGWQWGANIAGWCGFSFKKYPIVFSIFAGIGDLAGATIGNLATHRVKYSLKVGEEREIFADEGKKDYFKKIFLESYGLYGIPSFISGLIWQYAADFAELNASAPWGEQISDGVGIGLSCATGFLFALIAMRHVLSKYAGQGSSTEKKYIDELSAQTLKDDFLAGLNVAAAAGAFAFPFPKEDHNPFVGGFKTFAGYFVWRLVETIIRGKVPACATPPSDPSFTMTI